MASASAPTASSHEGDASTPPAGLIEIGVAPPLGEYVRQLWQRRDFIKAVPLGQLRAQNQNTVLGNAWHLLNPLLLAGVYYLIFGILFLAGGQIDDYPAYLIVGIMVFTFTQKGLMAGTRTVVSNVTLIKQIQFPRAALPIAATIAETLAQLPAVLAMMLIVLIVGQFPDPSWLLIVPALTIQAIFNLGLAFLSARATFHFRDVENVLPFVIRIWMYMSGLFFTLDFVADRLGAEWAVRLFEANPMWLFMSLSRGALIDSFSHPPSYWLYASMWAVGTVAVGFFWFRAHETQYSRA